MPGDNETAAIIKDIADGYDQIIHDPASTEEDKDNAVRVSGEVMLDIIKAQIP